MAVKLSFSGTPVNVAGQLKTLMGAVDAISEAIFQVSADGKISASEYFTLLAQLPQVQVIFQVFPEASKQFLSLTPEGQAAIIDELAAGLQIERADVKTKVDATLNGAANIYRGLNKAYAGTMQIYRAFKKQTPSAASESKKK